MEPKDKEELLYSIGRRREVLLELQGTIAQRIYDLLKKRDLNQFKDDQMQCHGTARYVCGEEKEMKNILYTKLRGRKIPLEKALKLPLPCGIQFYHPCATEAQHSAVLLGKGTDNTAIVFQKDGGMPLDLCTFNDVKKVYRNAVRFYAVKKPPPLQTA